MPIDFQLPSNPPAQIQPASAPSFDDQYTQARSLANKGQPELALAAYSALLARSPGNADVLLGRGIVYSRLGRWREAEADLNAAAQASPAYADVWEALGNTYRWSEQPARSLDAWEHLVALRPAEPSAYVARARAHRALGHAPISNAPARSAATPARSTACWPISRRVPRSRPRAIRTPPSRPAIPGLPACRRAGPTSAAALPVGTTRA
jgi:tetratricopeptide (TPR) repeat protein